MYTLFYVFDSVTMSDKKSILLLVLSKSIPDSIYANISVSPNAFINDRKLRFIVISAHALFFK